MSTPLFLATWLPPLPALSIIGFEIGTAPRFAIMESVRTLEFAALAQQARQIMRERGRGSGGGALVEECRVFLACTETRLRATLLLLQLLECGELRGRGAMHAVSAIAHLALPRLVTRADLEAVVDALFRAAGLGGT